MADTKVSALATLTTIDPVADFLQVVDVSDTTMAASGTNKKITPVNLGFTPASGAGIVLEYGGHIETVAVKSYVLTCAASRAMTVNSFTRQIRTSGSCTITIQLEGVNVTGLTGIPATTSELTSTATALNTVAAGNTINIAVTANSAALDLTYTLKVTLA